MSTELSGTTYPTKTWLKTCSRLVAIDPTFPAGNLYETCLPVQSTVLPAEICFGLFTSGVIFAIPLATAIFRPRLVLCHDKEFGL